jgi:N-acetylneuraminic acid mutarotase
MKKLLAFFLLVFFSMTFVFSQNYWTQKQSVPSYNRCSAAGMATLTKGYVACGHNAGGDHLKDMWEYDPLTNMWTQKADFPGTKRRWLTGFAINNKCYVGLGIYFAGSYTYYNDFYEFDPATNTWTTKASFPGLARGAAFCFVINGKAYVGGGQSSSGTMNDLWMYDPVTNVWSQKNNVAFGARYACASFAIGNYGYVGTGRNSSSNLFNDLWQYDPIGDTWTQKMSFPGISRWYATGFSIDNYGYIGTGHDGNTYLNDFWQYDPSSNSWQQMSSLSANSRAIPISFSIGNKGYLGTGEISGSTDISDFWEYTPSWYGIETNIEDKLSIYPNPACSEIVINPGVVEVECLSIYDTKGNLIMKNENLSKNIRLDISNYPKGVYIAVLISQNKTIAKRFIKN